MFMDNAMRVSVDYTKVRDRDYNYFNDFSPKVGTQVDNQLQQSLMAGYFQPNWNINTEVRTYQILLASAQQPHELMPRINHNYYQQGSWYDLAWNTELTKFGYNNAQAIEQNKGSAYTGTRVYTAPTLTMPLIDEAGYYLDSQYKLMYTRYDQEVPDNMSQTFVSRFTPAGANGVTLDEGIITRTLPSFRLKGGMTFERNQNWFGGDANQTLEPEFQYLYVPYKNQDNIGVYDSTSMRQDYYSLFSDRRYAGLDRISDSNRLSVGVTSRVYDGAGDERIRLAVAQAFDFVAPRVKLYPSETLTTNTRSPLSFEGDAKINEQWFAHAGAQYDVDQSRFSSANSAIEYRHERLISQLNHRFVRDANLVPNTNNEVTDLNQIGLLLTTPLNDQWHLYGGYYQELNQSVKSDRKVGLKYDSCCWSINFNLEWVNTPNNVNNTSTAERSFGIQFEMKGLGSVGTGSKGTSLDTEALPYIRPFNLRDQ
jgi:LPS-assembly protein